MGWFSSFQTDIENATMQAKQAIGDFENIDFIGSLERTGFSEILDKGIDIYNKNVDLQKDRNATQRSQYQAQAAAASTATQQMQKPGMSTAAYVGIGLGIVALAIAARRIGG